MRSSLKLIAAIFPALLAGCVHVPLPSTEERRASFAPYVGTRFGDQPIEHFLFVRTVFITSGLKIETTQSSATGQYQGIKWEGTVTSDTGAGTGIVIDPRGYLLTAAHVIRGTPLHVFFYDGSVTRHMEARLVWRGDINHGEPDLAVLHIDAPLPSAFTWAEKIVRGELVFACGPDYEKEAPSPGNMTFAVFAGHIRDFSGPGAGVEKVVTVFHDAPSHPGDSGGPLVTTDGRLIAMNTYWRYDYSLLPGSHGQMTHFATRPDLAWLSNLIENDYRQHGAGSLRK